MIESYLKQWLKKALNDISVMRHELALPEEEIITESICFHAQQAAEKLLKAYLIYKKGDVKRPIILPKYSVHYRNINYHLVTR